MKNVKELIELARTTKRDLSYKKQLEIARQEEAKRTRDERFNDLYEKVVTPFIETMRAVGFQYRNQQAKYYINPTCTAGPSLRLQYWYGADMESVYLNIDSIDKYDNMELQFSACHRSVKGLKTRELSDENISKFLEHAITESMKIMVE